MTAPRAVALLVTALACTACGKKAADATPESTAAAPATAASSAPAPAASGSPADSTPEQRELAEKQAKLDYASMEDRNINDANGQWAASATASSTFGDDNGKEPSSSNLASNVAGAPDGSSWTNNHQDMGFDWLQTTYARPVHATEVRVVFANGEGAEAVNRVEVQGTDGTWSTVWSGISDVKRDARGSRTWFVRTFEKTPGTVNAVKVTIANNVARGYKVIDAVQLVGN